MTQLPKDQAPAVTAARVRYEIQSRFSPIKNLTPQRIVTMLEQFDRGILRDAAWMMDKVERTDDMLQTVAPKRKKGLSRQEYDIVAYESWENLGTAAQLEAQKEFLQDFYNRLTTTHALKRNVRGGVRKMIYQMADAIGKEYAVHNISWLPGRDGSLTASLTFTPLWFFEATDGELRFLQSAGQLHGVELEPLRWMVTCGDGLMVASLVAYMFKHLPLKDWLVYSGRCGMPFVANATDAAYGSKEWDDGIEALKSIAQEFAMQHSRGSEISIHDMTVSGELPMPQLVERMDRALAMLWRGADLSTMSSKDGMGASLQQDESDLLVEDDIEMINETLEHALSLPALRWKFGNEVKPLCSFKLTAPDRQDEKAEQDKLHAAADYGVPIDQADYCERLNIVGTGEMSADAILTPPKQISDSAPGATDMANATTAEVAQIAEALAEDFADLHPLMAQIEAADTPEDYVDALGALSIALRDREIDPKQSAFAQLLEAALGTAVVDGASEILTAPKDPTD
jgi:phage gp29-like protein